MGTNSKLKQEIHIYYFHTQNKNINQTLKTHLRNIGLILEEMLFITLLSITYYRKKRVENTETKIYSALLTINVVALLSELIFYYYFQNSKVGIGLEISEKAYYASTIIWMYLITLYNFALSKQYSKLKIYDWSYEKKRNANQPRIYPITCFFK